MEKRGGPIIAVRFKDARERLGLTHEKLADELGWGRSTVTLIESATRAPGRKRLVELAEFFHVPVDYFTTKDQLIASALWVLTRLPRDELEAWVKTLEGRALGERIKPRD